MTRLFFAAAGAIGLILFVAFVTARLVRARTAGASIRMQVFLALAGIVGAFASGLGLLVLDRIEARATLLATEAARDEAATLAALVVGEMEARRATLDEVGAKLEDERARTGVVLRFALVDPAGRAVFQSGPGEAEPGSVVARAPIVVRGVEAGQVRVVKPTIVMRRLLADFAPTVLVISALLGAVAAAAAALIGRAIATPIEALTAFAVRVSEGERGATPPPARGREVMRLTRAIDSMRRELEGRPFVETFAADLSHELKNPVAAIRASAEVLADGALEEPEEAARFVRRIQEASARIEALLGDLLSLARIETHGLDQAEVVDLSELARRSASMLRERGAAVEIQSPGEAPVRGDAAWLARALDNLLDNALVHGAQRSAQVSLKRDSGRIVLAVSNPGEVARHVRSTLFRRFVTTRSDRGGTGLGLAIVRAVAEAHRGRAELAEPGPPRVEFRLSLPEA